MSVFKVKSVAIKVDLKHDLLHKIFKPVATALVKKQVKEGMRLCKHTSGLGTRPECQKA
jgi:hypothetical protein